MDQTLTFTLSSFAYKSPYQLKTANPASMIYNHLATFFSIRNIENEFIDFRNYRVEEQFTEIY